MLTTGNISKRKGTVLKYEHLIMISEKISLPLSRRVKSFKFTA